MAKVIYGEKLSDIDKLHMQLLLTQNIQRLIAGYNEFKQNYRGVDVRK